MSHTPSKYPNDPQQTQWLVAAQRGERAAFSHLVERYQKPVYNLCFRMLGETEPAEDATQEVFLRAFTRLDSYDPTRQFSTWLFAIAAHYCLDQLRQRRVSLVAWDDLPLADQTNQPEQLLLQAEANRAVRSLLEALPPEHRTVVILKYWHHLSYEEIAHSLETSVSAVKSRLFRARKLIAGQEVPRAPQPSVYSNRLVSAAF